MAAAAHVSGLLENNPEDLDEATKLFEQGPDDSSTPRPWKTSASASLRLNVTQRSTPSVGLWRRMWRSGPHGMHVESADDFENSAFGGVSFRNPN